MPKRASGAVPAILDGTYFEIVGSTNQGEVKAKCLNCENPIKGRFKPTSNFTTHLKSCNAQKHGEYQIYAKQKDKCKQQKTLDFPVLAVTSHSDARNEHLLLNFIVQTMSPLSMVENEHFIHLLKALKPTVSIPTRKTLTGKIRDEYGRIRELIKTTLLGVKYVCATADCWSARRRSFIGITCHWIKPDFKRRSTVLTLRRFSGSHTSGKIAEVLSEVFTTYGISKKTKKVITDWGSNFVKAFKDYGLEDFMENQDMEEINENDDYDLTCCETFTELATTDNIILPPHSKCVCHTLSLVATTDLNKELETRNLLVSEDNHRLTCKKLMRSTFAKCTTFWNKNGRSVKIAESVKSHLGCSVKVPVITRWNSTFDCLEQLSANMEKLDEAFGIAEVPQLLENEKQFILDYQAALKPVAYALDKLQAEKNCFYGFIAPILLKVESKLIALSSSNSTCVVYIATALLKGLRTRFMDILSLDIALSRSELIAAMSLPCFKLAWIPIEKQECLKMKFFEVANAIQVENESGNHVAESQKSNDFDLSDDDEDEHPPSIPVANAELECMKYFLDTDSSLASLNNYPRVKELFFQYNTALPSSAPAERLFSYGGMILRPHRSSMSDETFERLVYLKLNTECSFT